MHVHEMQTDVLVVGGGLGGCAAALAAARTGARVVLVEEFAWLGGQLTSQGVPPDEHPWIEWTGASASYRRLRTTIRDIYRTHYPLTGSARTRTELNPGAGWVSKLCHEPRVAMLAIEAALAPHRAGGRLRVLQPYVAVAADTDGDLVASVELQRRDGGGRIVVRAGYVIDATELGDLVAMTGTEHVTGFESRDATGEPSAPAHAQPDNIQALSVCFAIDHVDGDRTIDRPARYDHWRAVEPPFWGGPLLGLTSPHPRTLELVRRGFAPNPGDDVLMVDADQSRDPGDANLWTFRRIAARAMFEAGAYDSDITMVNWPSIDYFEAPVIGADPATYAGRIADARQLSLSMLYWLQTEAPRPDGGQGWPGLGLRPDVMGTTDGLAQAPYHRESRRIRAVTTVAEQDVSYAVRGERGAVRYRDSVGVGMYRIDLHPTTGGDNYLDVASTPFELPLGALLPQRTANLLAAAKNIGTTHITNGCYRLHPVEWNAGEVAGLLAATCIRTGWTPHQVQEKNELLEQFQRHLDDEGVQRQWPAGVFPY